MTTRSFSTCVPKVLFQPINDQGGGQYRMMLPASLIRRSGHAVTQAHPFSISPEALKILDPDVVVFQLYQTEKQQERIKAYRKALPRAFFIYEIDDLFWAVPEGSHHRNNPLLPHSKSNIRTTAKLCNAITVTTPELAEEMKKLTGHRDIRVVPNEVPRSFINAALAGRRSSEAIKSDKPRIGWAGGIGHGGDLRLVSDIVRELGDEVHWVFMGMAPFGVNASEHAEIHAGVPFADYPRKLGLLNLDIALAPLEANDFNRCKSDLRILEYAAAGYPVIASDNGTYKNCPVPQLPNDAQGWAAKIREMLADRQALDVAAESLHSWAVHTRCMDDNIAKRAAAYMPKNVEPFQPMTAISHIGSVVTVGTKLEGVDSYPTVQDAWKARPGADILYVRPGTTLADHQAARILMALDRHASACPLTNDGVYPSFGKFTRLTPAQAIQLDSAAFMADNAPIPCPFPAGPVVILSGSALSRFGLPDEERFGSLEFAMADWGARCMEGGRSHVTVANTFVHTDFTLPQTKDTAQHTLEHIGMWMPGFPQLLQSYQQGNALTGVREDLELAYHAISYQSPDVNDYATWYDLFETISDKDREAIANDVASWGYQPKISIILPTYNTPEAWLREALDSVLDQAYPNWELLVADDASTEPHVREVLTNYRDKDPRINVQFRSENGHICKASNTALEHATGDWVVFLDHDDRFAPQAMYLFAREIVQHPEAMFIYSDSDKITQSGEYAYPYLVPDFSYELLLAQNYVTHIAAYRLNWVKQLGGLQEGMEGSQDWDLVLRYLDETCGTPPDRDAIRHIPHVLYHWRESENSTAGNAFAKPYALEAGRKAVVAHLHRAKQNAFVGPHPVVPLFNLVRFLVPENAPKVTIIIPTKENHTQLHRCLSSVLGATLYSNYNVLILDNGKSIRETVGLVQKFTQQKNIRVQHMPGEFNYAGFNNQAVEMAEDAEFVCLMNDDVEVIEPSWLNDMVGLAMRAEVGAVGAKLLYPDGRVQQGGIIWSPTQPPGASALHLWQRLGTYDTGQTGRAVITQPVMAVTGACMVVNRSIYQAVGGMDAIRFPVDWNDVDLCIRLHKAGYRNIICAEALMRHHEGQTKKRLQNWKRDQMLADEAKLLALHGDITDPYIHPSLVFEPHLTQLSRTPPSQPWHADVRPPVLVINGDDNKMRGVFKDGYLPFGASLEGHYMVVSVPPMPNVRPIDMREDTEAVHRLLLKLGVTDHIVFCGIRDGTLGSVGFLRAVAEKGVRITYEPISSANTGNPHEYYDPTGWRATWQRFLDAVQQDAQAAAAD